MANKQKHEADRFDLIAGQMAIQGRSGNREGVNALYEEFLIAIENRDNETKWLDFVSWEKVPLAQLDSFDPDLLSLMDANGYVFAGQAYKAGDIDLLAIRGMSMERIRRVRAHIEEIQVLWVASRRSAYRDRRMPKNLPQE